MADADLGHFIRLASALSPYLDRLVIVGGWAHRLHRETPLARPPTHDAVFTNDTDIAIPESASLQHEGILASLRAAGFEEEFLGEDRPPVTHYKLGSEGSGFYAEFLVPDRRRRPKANEDTIAIGGVVAQRLPLLDILTLDPWTVGLTKPNGNALAVRVASPVSFLAHKLLRYEDRHPDDRPKDLLYIHDTIELFGGSLEALASAWTQLRERIATRLISDVHDSAHERFDVVTDEIRKAVRIQPERQLDPESFRAACAMGLSEILEIGLP